MVGEHGPQLTSQNLERLKKDIPFTSLCLTFQHAVQVAIQLQLKYVWIDSLCIMQDVASDWAAKASTMCDVYANGLLNISATNPQNPCDGFITRRSINLTPIKFMVQSAEGA